MVVGRLMFCLQLLLCYVWIVSDSRSRCEVCGYIGIIEDDDREVDRDELLSDTLLNAGRARNARLWHYYPVDTIIPHGRSGVLLVPRS